MVSTVEYSYYAWRLDYNLPCKKCRYWVWLYDDLYMAKNKYKIWREDEKKKGRDFL